MEAGTVGAGDPVTLPGAASEGRPEVRCFSEETSPMFSTPLPFGGIQPAPPDPPLCSTAELRGCPYGLSCMLPSRPAQLLDSIVPPG